jgi:PST family polysaccharide transporter
MLVPEQFGLVAVATGIVMFFELASRVGLRDVIVAKPRQFAQLGATAFWISCGLGIASAAALYFAASWVGTFIGNAEVVPLLQVAALIPLLGSPAIVFRARQESLFGFRFLVVVSAVSAAVRVVAAIWLVWAGGGAMALIVAGVIATAVSTLMLVLFCSLEDWRFRRCALTQLVASGFMLFLAGLLAVASKQGDYVILSRFRSEAEVGYYFIAFSMGFQLVLMFSTNLGRVLLPALADLDEDRARQRTAFLRASSALLLLATPVCLIQAALAEPLIRGLLREVYLPAAAPMAILLGGMFFRLSSFVAVPLLKARGRFNAVAAIQCIFSPLILLLAGIGAWWEGAIGCAIGVAIGSAAISYAAFAIAVGDSGNEHGLRPALGGATALLRQQAIPLACGLPAAAIAWLPGLVLPNDRIGGLAHLVTGSCLGIAVYVVLIILLAPAQVGHLLIRTRTLWQRVPVMKTVIGTASRRLPRHAPLI